MKTQPLPKDATWLRGIEKLIASPLLGSEGAGRLLLKGVRLAWGRRQVRQEHEADPPVPTPSGPFLPTRPRQMGDLLLWVPRHIDSYLIDDFTGGYGYSHVSIDTGEVDSPTGKPIMAEVTVGQVVSRKFQDEYGSRHFARIPLQEIGVDAPAFVRCVQSKLGEPYDVLDALTLGEIEDPAKEICSSLAADCLPKSERQAIATARRKELLRGAAVSVTSRPNDPHLREFVSPNGFAEFYGAPSGKHLRQPDTLVRPRPLISSAPSTSPDGWSPLEKIAFFSVIFILLTTLLVSLRHPVKSL